MAIHPIDLSAVYSQMDKVAQFNASQNQTVQAQTQVSQEKAVEQNLQKTQTVQEAARNETKSDSVKSDGRQGAPSGGFQQKNRHDTKSGETEEPRRQWSITDPRLGLHVDISR
ncbi:MAG: hypothetical protein J1D88_01470 [Treponema sp.]|nr:hypothetical protein [Treponema sp.]